MYPIRNPEMELKRVIGLLQGENPRLPAYMKTEPGSFLYLLKKASRQNPYSDGRSASGLPERELAQFIEKKSNMRHTRGQHISQFGLADNEAEKWKQHYYSQRSSISAPIAHAFIWVALRCWVRRPVDVSTISNPWEEFSSFESLKDEEIDYIADTAVKLMEDISVYQPFTCRPSLGVWMRSFYEEQGKKNNSVIVSVNKYIPTSDDPNMLMNCWTGQWEAFFEHSSTAIHAWVLNNPLRSNGPTDFLESLTNLFLLQASMRVACEFNGSLREKIFRRGVVALRYPDYYGKPTSRSLAELERSDEMVGVSNGDIFVNSWDLENQLLSNQPKKEFVGIATIAQEDEFPLHFVMQRNWKVIAPAWKAAYPSVQSGYLALHRCCREALKMSEDSDMTACHARDGWIFLTIPEFLRCSLPFQYAK